MDDILQIGSSGIFHHYKKTFFSQTLLSSRSWIFWRVFFLPLFLLRLQNTNKKKNAYFCMGFNRKRPHVLNLLLLNLVLKYFTLVRELYSLSCGDVLFVEWTSMELCFFFLKHISINNKRLSWEHSLHHQPP